MDRMDKVNQQLKREISQIIQRGEINDPRIMLVTIQYVRTSRDLRQARVGISALTGKKEDVKHALAGLESAAGLIRSLLGKRLRMRYTPELKFYYDETIDHSFSMDRIFDELHENDAEVKEVDHNHVVDNEVKND